MRSRTRLGHWAAVVVLFTLFAGEAVRNTLSWWGFAVWDGVLAVALAVVGIALWREGRRVREPGSRGRIPVPRAQRWSPRFSDQRAWLIAFLLLAAISLVWSAYPAATMLAILVLGVTTMTPVVLSAWIGWPALLRALAVALHAILVLSLLFELVVAVVIRRPVLPVFPVGIVPGERIPQAFYWSRALLLEGGRIQGILGNANLLGFVALLALSVTGCLLAARGVRPAVGWGGVALAVAMLALTRSSTVLAAVGSCVVVLALVLLWRRGQGRDARRVGFWTLIAVLLASAAGVLVSGRALLPLLGKSEDLTGRLDIWAAVAGLVGERPVLGWGWISYWVPGVEPYAGLAIRRGVEYLQAHNAYLDVTVQLGVVGLLVFTGLLVSTCVAVARHGVPVEPGAHPAWVLSRALPALLLTALFTQALAESRLLVEGNWALLCLIALAARSGVRLDAVTRAGEVLPPRTSSR
jgi:exopolysaccharide production protein ExoQ